MAKAKYDFHKVSEGSDSEVYQAMERLHTKVSEVTGTAPVKYGPFLPKKVSDVDLEELYNLFSAQDIQAVTLSKTGGITVRVARSKDNPVNPEPDVIRLPEVTTKKGGE